MRSAGGCQSSAGRLPNTPPDGFEREEDVLQRRSPIRSGANSSVSEDATASGQGRVRAKVR